MLEIILIIPETEHGRQEGTVAFFTVKNVANLVADKQYSGKGVRALRKVKD